MRDRQSKGWKKKKLCSKLPDLRVPTNRGQRRLYYIYARQNVFFPTLPSTLCYLNRKESLTCRAADQISHGQAIAVAQVMHIWK